MIGEKGGVFLKMFFNEFFNQVLLSQLKWWAKTKN